MQEVFGGIVGRVKSAVACEHRLRVLRVIEEGCGPEGCVASFKDLAAAAGVTPTCARSSLRALVRAGLVRAECRTLPNGANGANAYFVTSQGAEVLGHRREEVPAWRA